LWGGCGRFLAGQQQIKRPAILSPAVGIEGLVVGCFRERSLRQIDISSDIRQGFVKQSHRLRLLDSETAPSVE
jgi:hypothetical protein